MGFSRQEHWSGLPFPSPGDLPDPGIKPSSLALQADSLPLSHWQSPTWSHWGWALIQFDRCLQEGGGLDPETERRQPCEEGGQDWSDAGTRQGTRGYQKLEGNRRIPLQILRREHGPADTLILDSSLQNCETVNVCCFKSPSLWCFVSAAIENGYTQFSNSPPWLVIGFTYTLPETI